jgi:hypothetical protein
LTPPLDPASPWDFVDPGVEKTWLARERERGLAGKVTPPCVPDTCRACGLDCAFTGRPPAAGTESALDATVQAGGCDCAFRQDRPELAD